MQNVFISTSIPYANSYPHLGFALEIVLADVYARYRRERGDKVFFSTGLDEHGTKIALAAQKRGITPPEFVDDIYKKFSALKQELNLSYDSFIRTTSSRHIRGAQALWELCKKDIYKKEYQGLYCTGCEAFYKEGELKDNICPIHKKKLIEVKEENYFFALSRYEDKLKKIIESDKIKIFPSWRKKEVLNFINQGLDDFSISRPRKRVYDWGIPVPGDESQLMYVWFDALSNYITALGFPDKGGLYQEFWSEKAEKIHVIGKDIMKFHLIYWPAILLSASLPLPDKVYVHGFITVDKEKMSKSLGNVVKPEDVITKYSTDVLRYYLSREIPSYNDGDFSYSRLDQIYSSELVNELGNVVSRIVTMMSREGLSLKKTKERVKGYERYDDEISNFNFSAAMELVRERIKELNEEIDLRVPWKLEGLDKVIVLKDLAINLNKVATLLLPFMPKTAASIKEQLRKGQRTEVLFPRLK